MDKSKFFNEKNDKIMKKVANVGAIIAVVALLLVSVLTFILYKAAPQLLFS